MSSNPNYDSEFCGKLPIHLINTVQPYGALQNKEKHEFASHVQETYTRLVEQVYDKNDISFLYEFTNR